MPFSIYWIISHPIIVLEAICSIAPNTANPILYPNGPKPNLIGAILAGFKSTVIQQINQLRKTPGIPVWQRNYYEHIILTEKEYLAIETYIENNPACWAKDTLSQ